jgi:hypothetical protein
LEPTGVRGVLFSDRGGNRMKGVLLWLIGIPIPIIILIYLLF